MTHVTVWISSAFLSALSETSAFASGSIVERRGLLTYITLRHGVAVVDADGAKGGYAPDVRVGNAYRVVDASGVQVGAIVEPVGCAVVLAGEVVGGEAWSWMGGQVDANADGFVNGDDFDVFSAWFRGGCVFADFDCNGFVNGEDFDAFVAGFEPGGVRGGDE